MTQASALVKPAVPCFVAVVCMGGGSGQPGRPLLVASPAPVERPLDGLQVRAPVQPQHSHAQPPGQRERTGRQGYQQKQAGTGIPALVSTKVVPGPSGYGFVGPTSNLVSMIKVFQNPYISRVY